MSEQQPSHSLRTLPFTQPTLCRRYEGRVAIVTGAAQGLGLVIAKRLAEEGAELSPATFRASACGGRARIAEGPTAHPAVAGDLSEPGVADDMVHRALDEFGHIDTLVNNAAALIRLKLVDFTEELMQKAVRWNVWNTLRCCKAVLPHMIEQRYGRIVNIGGEAWRTGAPYHTLLAGIGKGSMIGLTVDLGRRGRPARHHGQLRLARWHRDRGGWRQATGAARLPRTGLDRPAILRGHAPRRRGPHDRHGPPRAPD